MKTRIKNTIERVREVGGQPLEVLEKVASFPTVEEFQAWKNRESRNPDKAYCLARLGRSSYLTLRNQRNEKIKKLGEKQK